MLDRYKYDQFYQGEGTRPEYQAVQEFTDNVYKSQNLLIATLAMDFIGKSPKDRKAIESKWIDVLPKLTHVKALSVRHRVNQDYFNAICKMKNLISLEFWTSTVEDISNIKYLSKLKKLKIWSFSRLKDISHLILLKGLKVLSIDNCFRIGNFEILGKMTWLIGLELCGNSHAPKNLRLNSLIPYESLKKLRHLDLSIASVVDRSFESVLRMTSLERLDITSYIPKKIRDEIKAKHKRLNAGFFMDWDFENKRFYEGKKW